MQARYNRIRRLLIEALTISLVALVCRIVGGGVGCALAWGAIALILIEFAHHLMRARFERDMSPAIHAKRAFLDAQNTVTRRGLRMLEAVQVLSIPMGIGVAVWATWGDGLHRLAHLLYARPPEDTIYFVTSDPIVVFVPTFMASVLVCALLLGSFNTVVAGRIREAWRDYSGIDGISYTTRFARGISQALVGLGVISAICVLMFLDSYTRITDDGVAINRFWGAGEESHGWQSVSGVELLLTADKVGSEPLRRYRVSFVDGSVWQTMDSSFARSLRSQAAAVRYTARRSHRRIEETRVD